MWDCVMDLYGVPSRLASISTWAVNGPLWKTMIAVGIVAGIPSLEPFLTAILHVAMLVSTPVDHELIS